MPEKLAVIIMKNLVNGFYELHKKNIIHRDLKQENVFVTYNYNE